MQLKSIQRVKVIRNCTFYLALYYFFKSLMYLFWLRALVPSSVNYVFMVVLNTMALQIIKVEKNMDLRELTNSQRFLYGGVLFLLGSEAARYMIELFCV